MKSNIAFILYNLAPEVLTDKDIRTAEAQEELTKLYEPELQSPLEPELAIQQQQDAILDNISRKIHNAFNDYDKVASTVDAPILDETNILYKVDEVDDALLFKTLELHHSVSGQNNIPIPTDGDDTLNLNKVPYKQYKNTINEKDGKHIVKEVRAQQGTNQSNQIEGVLSDADQLEEDNNSLQDINLDYKSSQLYFKEKEVIEQCKFLLKKAWDIYNKHLAIRDSSTGKERLASNRLMMSAFVDIRRYQSYIEKIEKCDYEKYARNTLSHRQKQYDYYLDKFVTRQQEAIRTDSELKREREDVLNKYDFLRNKPVIKPFIPSWKQAA